MTLSESIFDGQSPPTFVTVSNFGGHLPRITQPSDRGRLVCSQTATTEDLRWYPGCKTGIHGSVHQLSRDRWSTKNKAHSGVRLEPVAVNPSATVRACDLMVVHFLQRWPRASPFHTTALTDCFSYLLISSCDGQRTEPRPNGAGYVCSLSGNVVLTRK